MNDLSNSRSQNQHDITRPWALVTGDAVDLLKLYGSVGEIRRARADSNRSRAALNNLAPEMAEAILAYDTPEHGTPSADQMLAAERRLLDVAAKLRALTADQEPTHG